MPETRTYTVYKFDELPERGKEKALQQYWDINVDHDWWLSTYEDAENAGLKISWFDLDRGRSIGIEFLHSGEEAVEAILVNHGPDTDTYKEAQNWKEEYHRLVTEQCQEDADMFCVPGNSSHYEAYLEYNDEIDTEDINKEFLRAIGEEYLSILQREWDRLTEEEQVKETLISNDYWFTEGGSID